MMNSPPPPSDRLFAIMEDGSNALTWAEMATKRNRIAHALAHQLPEDIIAGAIYSKNSVEWCLCWQVCVAMGLRFSPINWHLVADEVAYIVDDCDADVVFFDGAHAKTVAEVRPRTPKVQMWVCMDAIVPGSVRMQELLNAAPADAIMPAHSRAGGQIAYTGGTSGKPKGALRNGDGLSAEDPEAAARRNTVYLEKWGLGLMMPHPIQLLSAPCYHSMPTTLLSLGQAIGSTVVLQQRFDGAKALEAIHRHRVNGFYMPPILLKRLLQLPKAEWSKYDLSSVKNILVAGAPCPTTVKEGISEMFGPILRELYGASELGAVTIMEPGDMLRKPVSCGKVCPGMEVILLDDQKQRILEPGVAGEIYAKGNTIDGYHKLEKKTKDAMFGEYFSVGDIGFFDADGFLYISDRKIDMVISGGVNIYPAAVEEVLHAHPDVEDVAVFGVPDEDWGERVHAALKARPGAQLSPRLVLDWCSGRLGKFQLPREEDISFHAEDFPRSEAGKVRKRSLKEKVLEAYKQQKQQQQHKQQQQQRSRL